MKSPLCRRSPAASAGPILLLAAVLAGCATPTAVVRKDPVLSEWKPPGAPAAARRPDKTELPPALTTAPMKAAPVARAAPEPVLPTVKVGDLNLTDEADVATVLRTLAKAALVSCSICDRPRATIFSYSSRASATIRRRSAAACSCAACVRSSVAQTCSPA